MARTPLIAGNWKMHKTLDELKALAGEILAAARELVEPGRLDVGIFPTAVNLPSVAATAREVGVDALIGAQNMHYETQGAFTGEISGAMIAAAGGNSVILGHSERRHIFGEDSELVGKKVAAALAAKITPILCVGELLEERDAGRTTEVVGEQLAAGLALVEDAAGLDRVIIAYEPVWAIGTGRTATPDQAQEVHGFVRGQLSARYQALGATDRSDGIRVLYGGSVKPENAGDLMSQPDIDGALVGGASLKLDSFLGICHGCP